MKKKNMNAFKQDKPICRTCLGTTDTKYHSLNAILVKGEQRTSLAQFLWEISKMDNVSETTKRLPQQICHSCLRKLKIAFSFVMQVQKANMSMIAALQKDVTINLGQPLNGVKECFVNCKTSIAHYSKDPLIIAKSKKRRLNSDSMERQQYIIEDSVDTITSDLDGDEEKDDFKKCKNECHKDILLALKGITDRLDTVEGNQEIITTNQGILFKQVKKNDTSIAEEEKPLVKKKIPQDVIEKGENRLVKKNANRVAPEEKEKSLVRTPTLTRECRVFLKRMKPFCGAEITRKTGEASFKEVSTSLPFDSHASVLHMEEQIAKQPEYAKALTATIDELRGRSEDVFTVIRNIFTDKILREYSWNGSSEKKAFCKLRFLAILRDVFRMQSYQMFETSIKKAIIRSYH